jgi:hypothetical protein
MPLADVVSRPAAKGDMATGSAEPAANDMVGEVLQKAMIWLAGKCSEESYLHAGFRRDFEITALSESAVLHVFAYTRYQLFVNGEYVGRGPNRFENRRPEYDSWNVRERLRPGRNVVAVLVHRDRPSGRVMHHAPGFTARLDFSLAAGKGQAIPSIRLENFRDGLEDYAYARILERMIAEGKAKPALTANEQVWLGQAEEALKVPPTLVKSLTQYNRSTGDLYEWRDRIAGAITSSPFTEVNPWQDDFRLKKSKPLQTQAR